ncbi:hypothetical protein BpHYR1_025518 [Brachionus plicatilis]|uniref:Uncharacterized protein n=1 Tax=Brachionus plicatilis TaxID=10195 RepID=A0A3M7RCC1_BRAPC|nr:hypothetical protein BpHYR1_025518 [Brachionus plicatilis]
MLSLKIESEFGRILLNQYIVVCCLNLMQEFSKLKNKLILIFLVNNSKFVSKYVLFYIRILFDCEFMTIAFSVGDKLAAEGEQCQSDCGLVCEQISGFFGCGDACSAYCNANEFKFSEEDFKCSLLCDNLKFEKLMCNNLCRQEGYLLRKNKLSLNISHDKSNYGEGCQGNGREICYKLCRLEHEASIETCLDICCSNNFKIFWFIIDQFQLIFEQCLVFYDIPF